jgi:glycosyltransferase involved in cell wall biosynthesis
MGVTKLVRDLIAGAKHLPPRRSADWIPEVSVVMPVYRDRANGITRRAIDSVLSQTLTNIELILVDDGSNDGLLDVLHEYRRVDDRVAIIRHEENSGLPALRVNEGLLAAKAPLVAYQFEDDFWYRDALASLREGVPERMADFVVYGNVLRITHLGERIDVLGNVPIDRSALLRQNLVANCSVLHPLSLMDRIGMYDPQVLLRRFSDYDLWLRATRFADFVHVPKVIGESIVAHEHSLGRGVHLDRELTLPLVGVDKTAQLVPTRIASYDVLMPFRPTTRVVEAAIWREAVAPYAAQHPDLFTRDERCAMAAKMSADRNNAILKTAYSTSIDVTFGNFVRSVGDEEHLFTFYGEALPPSVVHLERAILYRTVSPATTAFAAACRERGASTIYVMDDNMFAFHEVGPEHAYLKPGTPHYTAMRQQVETADLVIVYSDEVERACREHNPRVVRLETNVRAARLCARERAANGRRKVALITSPIREAELKLFWSEITAALEGAGDVELHCWGFDYRTVGEPDERILQRAFDHSYERYLDRLQAEGFEIILAPLLDDTTVKRSKSPVKYVEAAAAGALLLVSDVAAYGKVRGGVTAVKVANDAGAWGAALTAALAMAPEAREAMVACARRDVAGRFTSEHAAVDMATALIAADFHGIVRSSRSISGRPAILYVFGHTALGGATLHLLDHARLMASLGVEPVVCVRMQDPVEVEFRNRVEAEGWELVRFPFSVSLAPEALSADAAANLDELASACRRLGVRLIHATPYSAAWASIAEALEVPLVFSLHQAYGVPPAPTQFGRPHGVHCSSQLYGAAWSSSFVCPTHAFPAPVPAEHFVIGEGRLRGVRLSWDRRITVLVSGTLQPRKGQLRAAAAVANLIEEGHDLELVLAGYTEFVPDYVRACRTEFDRRGLGDRLTIRGFVRDMRPLYAAADIVLCSSDDESQPQAILFGMACGCLAVTAPAGGVREIVKDGFNGFLAGGTGSADLERALGRALRTAETQRRRIVARGIEASWTRSHPRFTRLHLVELYVDACREAAVRRSQISKVSESRVLEVALTGDVGKRLYLYGLTVDGLAVELPSLLPEGWSQHTSPAGKFLLKAAEASSVVTFRVAVARQLQAKVLKTSESGGFHVEVGDVRTSFDAFSEITGGAFRTFDVPLPILLKSSSRSVWPFEGERAFRMAVRADAQDDLVTVEGRGDAIVVRGVTREPRRVSLTAGGKVFGTFTPASFEDAPTEWTVAVPIAGLDPGRNLLIPVGRTATGLEQVGTPIVVGRLPSGDAILPDDVVGMRVTVLPLNELDFKYPGLLDSIEVDGEMVTAEGWCRSTVGEAGVSVVILNDAVVVGVTAPWFERAELAEALDDSAYRFGGWRTTCVVPRPGNVLVGLALEFPPRVVYVLGGTSVTPPALPVHGDGGATHGGDKPSDADTTDLDMIEEAERELVEERITP